MATEDMVAMDMEEDVEMLMPNQNQKLMLTTDMEVTEVTADMDTAASADLLLLKHLQLLIMDMVDTEDMVDMDMVVNDDLLSPTMGMEDTEAMDTDMDVKWIRLSFKGHQL